MIVGAERAESLFVLGKAVVGQTKAVHWAPTCLMLVWESDMIIGALITIERLSVEALKASGKRRRKVRYGTHLPVSPSL
jgi:hypothetical protein